MACPRAARLRELETDPPVWLVEAIGRVPGRGKNESGITLAWRRAALHLGPLPHRLRLELTQRGPRPGARLSRWRFAPISAPSARSPNSAMNQHQRKGLSLEH